MSFKSFKGSLLNYKYIPITPSIQVINPTIKNVLKDEQSYYNAARALTNVPFDMMVQLSDIGIDYEQINEFTLFYNMLLGLEQEEINWLIKGVNKKDLKVAVNNKTKELALINFDESIVIDRLVQSEISQMIRRINGWQKTLQKAGNQEAKEYLLKVKRKELKQYACKEHKPFIETALIALICTEEFSYTYNLALNELNLYQFNQSLKQITHKKDYEKIMSSAYFGMVDITKIDNNRKQWINI